jgi:sugar-specific transcriptional regulator TrmB
MKETSNSLTKLLQLNQNERIILELVDRNDTPVTLAKRCQIPRPTIYLTLNKLTERGLILHHKIGKKISWSKNSSENINKLLDEARFCLTEELSKTQERIFISDKMQILIHKGKDQIFKLLSSIITRYPKERLIVISGDLVIDSWNKVLGVDKINALNRQEKEAGMTSELIASVDSFKNQAQTFGIEWAKGFEGRSIRVQNIEAKYLDYASQIFIVKDQAYLVSMDDEVFIEIRNDEIIKLILSLAKFIQDHSEVFDPNALLRELIEKENNK